MNFEKFFRFVSYAAVFCGFLSLWVSGTFGIVGSSVFVAFMAAAWFLEDSRWQISERLGTGLIVLALPAFYLLWKAQLINLTGDETALAGILARMILSLAAIKLLQRKSDRDWIFLYLMSFFETLLAAGLSISSLYLISFIAYLLVMTCTIIAFEIRKTSRAVEHTISGEQYLIKDPDTGPQTTLPFRRLPATSILLIVFIILLALPMFFILPRVGGAGFGGAQSSLSTSTGFTDSVRLGRIGSIQQNDAIVMRVKIEGQAAGDNLYFRGVALDTFDNQTWSKAKFGQKEPRIKGDGDLIQVDEPASREYLSIQTIYLEPLDTPILFALPRAVAVQGNFPVLYKDAYGAISYQRNYERVTYRVLSDTYTPPASQLQADQTPYTADVQNYRDLPPIYDPRIAELAAKITENARNRYDKARAVENYLKTNFGYTLEQKAAGREPLADFLFNVREGHCEYFATAMAVMLRTQGIATRIVNGFHGGEYNDTADVTVVRQQNAHSWVEVYFPKENVWVTFDPTPSSSDVGGGAASGIGRTVNKYLEALETFWIQYFVAFDNQEQRSLAHTLRNGFVDYQAKVTSYAGHAQDILAAWWTEVRGDKGLWQSLAAIGYGVSYVAAIVFGVVLLVWFTRKLLRLKVWRKLWERYFKRRHSSVVEFYDHMQLILATKGITRESYQTPLEFAYASGIPQAIQITERYNSVRFGKKDLLPSESAEIEIWLKDLEIRPNSPKNYTKV